MLDWLKTILGDTYTEDIDKQVSAEIGKAFVARADFNTANEAKKTLETQAKEHEKQLKEFQTLAGSNQELTTKLTEAQEANKAAKAQYDAQLKKITLDSKVETALLGAKARNTKAVRALLDESKISIDGENVLGLNEQLDALKKDAAYLFGDTQPQNPAGPVSGDPPAPSSLETTDMAAYKAAREKL